jgi:hypothetical protein
VTFGHTRAVRKQYSFQPAGDGYDAWDVDHLVELSLEFPVVEVPLDSIADIDSAYWFAPGGESPTVRVIIRHIELVQEVDPSYPIILGADGRVMDGMHRVVRAVLEGRTSIRAVRFERDPEPDYRNCQPTDLPYD